MSNIKLKDHNWATQGVYDINLQKTQEEINQSNENAKVNLTAQVNGKSTIEVWRLS